MFGLYGYFTILVFKLSAFLLPSIAAPLKRRCARRSIACCAGWSLVQWFIRKQLSKGRSRADYCRRLGVCAFVGLWVSVSVGDPRGFVGCANVVHVRVFGVTVPGRASTRGNLYWVARHHSVGLPETSGRAVCRSWTIGCSPRPTVHPGAVRRCGIWFLYLLPLLGKCISL